MRRLAIAVDCDDVLVRTTEFFVEAYNKKFGTNVTLAQAHNTNLSQWGVEEDELTQRWKLLMATDEYQSLGPDPAEAEVLRRLAAQHELHLVTARKEHEREFTQTLLDRELPGVFGSMDFVGWAGSKGEVCQKIRADLLIDDNIQHLMSASQCGVPYRIWFGDYPWQKQEDNEGELAVRCHDWHEVEAEIERIA